MNQIEYAIAILSYLREEEDLGTLKEFSSFGSFSCFSAETREGNQIKVEVSFVKPNSSTSAAKKKAAAAK